jgi:extracellular elastinolytic metalloproteinase
MQMYVWTGADHLVVVNSPNSIAGNYLATGADFGPALDFTGITGDVVAALDAPGAAGSTIDACDTLTNAGALTGNIALVQRGNCSFVTKVRNVQNAGAVAAIVVNQVSDTPIPMGDDGTGRDIDIPSVMIGLSAGTKIRRALPGVNATVKLNVAPPSRDSAMDDGVMTHEYGHGVSNRLTGGPSNTSCLNHPQSGGMGEGWSDFWALALTAKGGSVDKDGTRGLATYLIFEPPDGHGIRSVKYSPDLSIDPLTYGDIASTGGEVHAVGEIWASALWDMYWNLVNAYGFEGNFYDAASSAGNILALQLVMDALKLQPCSPTFLDARDAILLADQNDNGGANQCLIWKAFAKRGMGVNADDGGNDFAVTTVHEDFTLPAQCAGN